jgi:hypothetical protein
MSEQRDLGRMSSKMCMNVENPILGEPRQQSTGLGQIDEMQDAWSVTPPRETQRQQESGTEPSRFAKRDHHHCGDEREQPTLKYVSSLFSLAKVIRVDYLAFPASNFAFPTPYCNASDLDSFSLQCEYLSANESVGERWVIAHYVRYCYFPHSVFQALTFGG